MEVKDAQGNKAYARDYSLKTVRYRTELTGDGSEYHVVIDDGRVARQSSDKDRRRTPAEAGEAIVDFVQEVLEASEANSTKDRKALMEALKKVRPAVPPGT